MFKTFPEFTKLTLEDKDEYESYIKDFPPYANLAFESLMTWWNALDQAAVSYLNGNLVISYWLPGFEADAGLALVGTNEVDASLCALFDHLAAKGDRQRLIFVPESVVRNVQYPELFRFKAQRADHEYILSTAQYADLDSMAPWKKQKIQRQLSGLKDLHVEVRPLRLANVRECNTFLETVRPWWGKNINFFGELEQDALSLMIKHYRELELKSVALFIEGRLQGFCIYSRPHDSRHVIVHCIKATNSKMLRFELIGHLFAKYVSERGVEFVNINSDAGDLRLRMFMLTLGPHNFLHNYIVEPASDGMMESVLSTARKLRP